jgi:hypothetical protein
MVKTVEFNNLLVMPDCTENTMILDGRVFNARSGIFWYDP